MSKTGWTAELSGVPEGEQQPEQRATLYNVDPARKLGLPLPAPWVGLTCKACRYAPGSSTPSISHSRNWTTKRHVTTACPNDLAAK